MQLDDELCCCFHVSRRKILNFIRLQRPRRATQISECGGAGTGCGWCVPFLQRCFNELNKAEAESNALPTAEEYVKMRQEYLNSRANPNHPDAT